MQSGKNMIESAKESAANVAASARSGMEKTKATVQEKVENLTGGDPIEHRIAKERKDERIAQAELEKLEARDQNTAAKLAAKTGTPHPGYTAIGAGAPANAAGAPTIGTGDPAATYTRTGHVGHGPGGTHPMPAVEGDVPDTAHPIGGAHPNAGGQRPGGYRSG